MKSWKRAVTVALCAASLLAGCGGDCGLSDDDSADEPQITVEQLRAANDPRSLLEKHDTVTVTVQESDQNDAVTYTAKFQYTRGVEDVLAWYHCRYTENSTSGKAELWGQANGAMDAARMESDSTEDLSLSIYLEGKYEQYVLDMIPRCPALEEDVEQSVDSCSEQDGAVLLSTTTRFKDAGGYYYTTLYYADPETGELLAMSVTDYIEDGEGGATEMGTTLYNWSYNEPYKTEPYKSGRYLLNDVVYATDDTRPACLLTVCLPAEEGSEDWWVNEYHVARGTYVNICCRSGCTLYADAALTQPIDDTVSIDTNGEEMTVYVVPDVPLN